MSDLYGYAGNNYTPGEDELQNGEIVIGLIVEKTLPRKYLNTYFKEVNEAKKNATLMGRAWPVARDGGGFCHMNPSPSSVSPTIGMTLPRS